MNQNQRIFEGKLTDGTIGRVDSVKVWIEDRKVVIQTVDSVESRTLTWSIDETIRNVQSHSVVIYKRDNEDVQLWVDGQGFSKVLFEATGSDIRAWFHGFSPTAKLGLALFSVIFVVVGLWFSADFAARELTRFVPLSWDEKLGESTSKVFAQDTCDEEIRQEFNDKVTSILLLPQERHLVKSIKVLDRPEVNAFAFPGGVIGLTKGFLHQVESPEELLGVLAHEVAHVKHRDSMTTLVRSTMFAVVWSLLIGDISGFALVDPSLIYTLATSQYNRKQESAADREGIKMLYRAGVPLQGLNVFFEKISKKDKMNLSSKLEIFSTHPSDQRRIAAVNELIANLPDAAQSYDEVKLGLTKADLANLKSLCYSSKAEILSASEEREGEATEVLDPSLVVFVSLNANPIPKDALDDDAIRDKEFYESEARRVASLNGLKVIYIKTRNADFRTKNGESFKFENKADWEGEFYMFDGEKSPQLIEEIALFPDGKEYSDYFGKEIKN